MRLVLGLGARLQKRVIKCGKQWDSRDWDFENAFDKKRWKQQRRQRR